MTCCRALRSLSRLTLWGMAGLFAVGCTIHDPPALIQLANARDAIGTAKKAGAHERFPDEVADLDQRFLAARGVFYSCDEGKALELAQGLIAEANALAIKPLPQAPQPVATRQLAPQPAVAPANRPPSVQLRVPPEGNVHTLLRFDGIDSSDPDDDQLTYHWDYGDGSTATFTFGVGTHRYARIGHYTVRLTVDDGRGGTDTAVRLLTVVSRQILLGDVLFSSDSSTLKPRGKRELAKIVQSMQDDPTLQAELAGHTSSTGPAAYNMGLSKRRTEAVATYLSAHGIARHRLRLAWKGETEPIAPNDTKENRAKNRRTDITLRPLAAQ